MPRKKKPLNWIVTFGDELIQLWVLHAPIFDAHVAKIVNCEPTQQHIWKDTDVLTATIKPGKRPAVRIGNEWRLMNFPVVHVYKRKRSV